MNLTKQINPGMFKLHDQENVGSVLYTNMQFMDILQGNQQMLLDTNFHQPQPAWPIVNNDANGNQTTVERGMTFPTTDIIA